MDVVSLRTIYYYYDRLDQNVHTIVRSQGNMCATTKKVRLKCWQAGRGAFGRYVHCQSGIKFKHLLEWILSTIVMKKKIVLIKSHTFHYFHGLTSQPGFYIEHDLKMAGNDVNAIQGSLCMSISTKET